MFGDTKAKLRRHLLSALIVGVVAGLMTAGIGILLANPVYSSSGTVELRLTGDPQEIGQGEYSAAEELINTAQTLLVSPRVLGPASRKLDPPVTAAELRLGLPVLAPARSLVLVLSTKGRSKGDAEAVISAVVDEFRRQLADQPLVSSSGRLALEWGSVDVQTELVSPAAGPLRLTATALIAAFLLAGAYLVARLILDERVRTPRQISRLTDVSVVATLEPSNYEARVKLLARDLNFLAPQPGANCVIGVAGVSGHGAGSRLVQSLRDELEQRGIDVAMVDADLRAHPMGSADEGLSTMLASQDSPGAPRVLLAGPVPPNASELLQRRALDDVVHAFRAGYRWTLVNCPPVVPVSDTGLLAPKLDILLLVVEAGQDSQDALREALAVVESSGGRLAGMVLVGAIGAKFHSPYEPGAGATDRGGDV